MTESIYSVLTAGYLLKHEKEILYQVEARDGASKMCLQVTNWALLLIRDGRDAGYFENNSDATRLFEPVLAFKKSCSSVLKFQSTPIPLSFIQVSFAFSYSIIRSYKVFMVLLFVLLKNSFYWSMLNY